MTRAQDYNGALAVRGESCIRSESRCFVPDRGAETEASPGYSEHIVGNRPGRVEPRAIKRRPKPHDLLTKPRDQARAELIGEKSP